VEKDGVEGEALQVAMDQEGEKCWMKSGEEVFWWIEVREDV
jgi:hypothetical protein